jgi:hypothetical protein
MSFRDTSIHLLQFGVSKSDHIIVASSRSFRDKDISQGIGRRSG